MEKLKRVVIKEEYVALTGCYKQAIVLNQMIYWSERIGDFDEFIKEENKRLVSHGQDELEYMHGWIYKNAEELAKECMITVSQQTAIRLLDKLVKNGWLSRRNNPKFKWDRTYQYRVNLVKISQDLAPLGYHLEGYKSPWLCNLQNGACDNQNGGAIPEITTETLKDLNNQPTTQLGGSVIYLLEEVLKDGRLTTNQLKSLDDYCEKLGADIVTHMINVANHRGDI